MKRNFNFTLESGETVKIGSPKLRTYKNLCAVSSDDDLIEVTAECIGKDVSYVYDHFTTDDIGKFASEYLSWIHGVKKSDPN